MSVVAEQGGELYALLVDQVSEVMSLHGQRVRAQSADPVGASGPMFSTGIYRLEGRLLVVLDVGTPAGACAMQG